MKEKEQATASLKLYYIIITVLVVFCLMLTGSDVLAAGKTDVFDFSWPDLSSPPKPARENVHPGDAALVVGISQYAFVPSVQGADKNASDWWTYLRQSRGIPLKSLGFLRNSQATAEGIRDEARRIAALARQGSTIWFVFIGHGVASANGEEGMLVGVDAQGTAKSLDARSIAQSEVESILSKSKASRVIMIVDSCFSGRSDDGNPLAPGLQSLVRTSQFLTASKTIRLTAGTGNQLAGPLPGAHRPAFSYLLLGAMRGWGDEDNDGNVTATEAVDYTNEVLIALEKNRSQTPEVIAANDQKETLLAVNVSETGPDIDSMILKQAELEREESRRRSEAEAARAERASKLEQEKLEMQLLKERDSRKTRRKVGIGFTVVGSAATLTGVALLGMYANDSEICDGLTNECRGKSMPQLIGGGIVGGLGVAALVTGIILIKTSKDTNNTATGKVAFSIVPTAGGMAAALSGRF